MTRARAAIGAAAVVVLVAATAFARPSGPLTAKVVGLRSSAGHVGCALYSGPKGYPTDPAAALQTQWCAIDAGVARCAFSPIPQGTYALACFHDENDNKKLDKNFVGIPTEGVAASNDAKGTFGPPSFDDAKFAFAGAAAELKLTMKY